MKKFLVFCFLALGLSSFSQVYFRNLVYNRKTAFLNVRGIGPSMALNYSLNYEWLFRDYGVKQGVGGGIGFSPNLLNPNKPLTFTAGMDYVGFWLHRYHHIEWGAGAWFRYETYKKTLTGSSTIITTNPADTVVVPKTYVFSSKTLGPFFVGRLGYRYQDPNGGLVLRAAWTPLFYLMNTTKESLDGQLISTIKMPFTMKMMYFSVSVGYNFY
ncbi:MAG: hypothetical protein IAF38_16245 [Bacteroidia bacterium]|nr:hypothetical protein [Bacteroidia bacterium]